MMGIALFAGLLAAATVLAAGPNLNGQWRQEDEGPNLILIAQDHDAVLVIFDGATLQGEPITYYGSGTISGRKVEYAYLFTRAPKGWKNGDMSLTLSPDGNLLEGHWEAGWDRGKVRFRRLPEISAATPPPATPPPARR